jgi:hypothetical protein
MGQQLQQQEHAVQTGENQKNRNLEWNMQGRALAAQKDIAGTKGKTKLAEHEFKAVTDASKQFETANKLNFEAYQKAQVAVSLLNSDNPVADTAVLNYLVKLSGDTGAITESDRTTFAGSKQIFDRMARAWAVQIQNGKLDEKSRGELLRFAELVRSKKQSEITANSQRLAAGLSKRLDIPAEELAPKIFAGFDSMDPAKAPGAAAAAPPAGPQLPPGIPPGSKEAVNARGEKGFLAILQEEGSKWRSSRRHLINRNGQPSPLRPPQPPRQQGLRRGPLHSLRTTG